MSWPTAPVAGAARWRRQQQLHSVGGSFGAELGADPPRARAPRRRVAARLRRWLSLSFYLSCWRRRGRELTGGPIFWKGKEDILYVAVCWRQKYKITVCCAQNQRMECVVHKINIWECATEQFSKNFPTEWASMHVDSLKSRKFCWSIALFHSVQTNIYAPFFYLLSRHRFWSTLWLL